MSAAKEIDCRFTDDLVCPYCGAVEKDDGEMNEAGEASCGECGKSFRYEVDYSKSFTSEQVPCLNGEPHVEKREEYLPGKDMYHCRACGNRRYVVKVVAP